MIAVIIFQGPGAGECTSLRCESHGSHGNETDAGRPVVGAVKYQKTREFSRGVDCTLEEKPARRVENRLIHHEHLLLIRRELIARCTTFCRENCAICCFFSVHTSLASVC